MDLPLGGEEEDGVVVDTELPGLLAIVEWLGSAIGQEWRPQ